MGEKIFGTDETPEEECSQGTKIIIEKFAHTLLDVLGKFKNKRETIVEKFLGVPENKTSSLSASFASYQRSQAIYALNMFPVYNKHCEIIKITNLSSDEGETTPIYERIKIKRNEKMSLLVVGEYFLKWKNVKLILEIYFAGYTLSSKLFCKSTDLEKINSFQDEFNKFMKKNNFFKGEKLVYLSRANLDFLKFPKLNWKDVVLKPEIKEEIMLNIMFPLNNEKKCMKSGIPWRRGLLMGGVAGTGKTQVCRILCNVLPENATLIWATPKALYDSEMVQHLFKAARYFSPTVIIIEDIDFIGRSRDFSQNPILGELLTQLDGNDPNHGIFVIATTNRPQQLDVALANRPSRFDMQLEFLPPNGKERMKLIKLFTSKMEFEENPPNFTCINHKSNGLTGAHIKEVFVYAQLKAIKRGSKKVRISDVLNRIKQCSKEDKTKHYRG